MQLPRREIPEARIRETAPQKAHLDGQCRGICLGVCWRCQERDERGSREQHKHGDGGGLHGGDVGIVG